MTASTNTVAITIPGNPANAIDHIDPSRVEATDQAQPTGRVLEGSLDDVYAEEWSEPAVLPDGRKCERIYLFSADEVEVDEADQLPWDDEHVARIELDPREVD